MATPTPVTLDELTAAKGHAQAMAASLGLSPGSTKIMVASALGTFAGSAMAVKAPAAAAVTSTRAGKQASSPCGLSHGLLFVPMVRATGTACGGLRGASSNCLREAQGRSA